MRKIGIVGGINVVILFIYMALVGAGVIAGFIIVIHCLANLIIARINFKKDNNASGEAFVAGAGIVLLIGFSACFSNFRL
jgi:hypothetical protein